MEVTRQDVARAVVELGIRKGQVVLIHSSMKSFGYVLGGPEAVIQGFLDVLGEEGTLVMPTLSQKNWESVYQDWYMDRPSDVGLLTEVFRKMPGVLRSNQATHSVAAIGAKAKWLTEGHTAYGPRYGAFGDYAFSRSSPWQKMYDMDASIVFAGVNMVCNTMKHLVEYMIFEEELEKIKGLPEAQKLKKELWHYDEKMQEGVWTYLDSDLLQQVYEETGLLSHAQCGNAEFICISAAKCVDFTNQLVRTEPEKWLNADTLEWFRKAEALREKNNLC